MVISRVLLIIFGFLLIFAAMHILAIIEGVDLSQIDFKGLAAYIFVSLLLLLFFFAVGRIISSLRSKLFEGLAMLLVIWFSFIYFIPGIIDTHIEDKADRISSFHKLYEKKIKILHEFEKRVLEELGEFTEEKRAIYGEYVESFYNNEYKQIEALEEQFKNEIADVAESCNNLRVLFPTTFYNMVSSEVSGRSYENFLDFYSYLQKLRRQFLRHWIDRVYKHDVKVLVNFVKSDENIYKARSRLSENFWKGVIINSVWVIIALLLGNFLFKRRIYPSLKNPELTEPIKAILLDSDKVTVHTLEPEAGEQIPNLFFGKIKYFKGTFTIEGDTIVTKEKKPFIYFCHPDEFPEDIKLIDLLVFFKRRLKLTAEEFEGLKKSAGEQFLEKRFSKLKTMEKYNILLAIMELGKWPIYIFYDFTFGLPMDKRNQLADRVKSLGLKNALIIDIVTKGDLWFKPNVKINISLKDGKYVSAQSKCK